MCKALEDGCNIAMMLEDDIEFCDDFKERLSNIKIPNDWDCLLLSYTCNSNFPGFEWITPNVAKAQRVDGLHTYIMKRNFMETFYERYRKQNPMAPNDHIIHLLMPDFNIYLLFPFFTKQRNGYSDNKQLGREDLNSKYPHFRNYLKDWNNSDYSKGSKG
jgi:GR25 family glycosyltransferase involved in LPS biosynthesis